VTLSLSIGATTAMFSAVDAVVLRPLPYPDAERLVLLWERNLSRPDEHNHVNPANFLAWRDAARSFAGMAAFVDARITLTSSGEEASSLQARYGSAPLLAMLGARPLLGRLFTEADDQPGAPRVALIDYDLWQHRFGGVSKVVGRAVRVNDENVTIVGVLPKSFRFFEPASLWLPIRFGASARSAPGRFLRVVARLGPGVSVARADLEMKTIALQRSMAAPELDANWSALAAPLWEDLVGDARRPLLVLFGAVSFLLLIACANVANLHLARGADRARELAVRVALGASPRRIVRQLLTESVFLAAVGAAGGVLLAMAGTRALLALVPARFLVAGVADVAVDGRVLAFTMAVALLTGIAAGLAPALNAAGPEVHERLKEGGRSDAADTRHRGRLRGALVVAETSLALVLLIGAGLMVRTFAALEQVALGFLPTHVLTADVALQTRTYGQDAKVLAFWSDAESRIAALPGVIAVGAISFLPLSGDRSNNAFLVEGQPTPRPGEEPVAEFRAITPGYFRAMGIPLEEGRAVDATDRRDAPEVAVVSRTLARQFWPNEGAVGHMLRFEWGGWHRVRIVGVVGDVRDDSPAAAPTAEIYRPLEQFPYARMALVVRSAADPVALARPVREALRAIDPQQAVRQLRPMGELVSASVGAARFSTALFGLFGGLGVALAVVGIYGVVAYGVQQRRQEFGIRLALGARSVDLLALVLRRGLALAGTGIAAGVAGALLLTRLMRNLLFGVGPADPGTFAWVVVVLAGVAALASYLPARRATKVDPMTALRRE
jgi:putative ABC transport system permease protein